MRGQAPEFPEAASQDREIYGSVVVIRLYAVEVHRSRKARSTRAGTKIQGGTMKKLEVASSKTLTDFMWEKHLKNRDVAELTHSGMRSVQRWIKTTGIPITKFDLLKMKVNARTQS